MRLTNRNPLALLYSSFLLGSIAVPYLYLTLRILIHNPLTAMLQVVLWLAACTTLLLMTWITRTRLEQALGNKLGKFFRPLLITAVIVAMALSWLIELGIANFALLVPIEYWVNLIVVSAIATAVTFIIISFAPPSRLERFLAARFGRGNKRYIVYRMLGCLVLAMGCIFVCSKLYEFYFLLVPTWH
jgi:hypothetical protein